MQIQQDSTQPSHPERIHLNESWEVNHWCEEFNLRADELKEIVKRVGPDVQSVRDYLARQSLGHEKSF